MQYMVAAVRPEGYCIDMKCKSYLMDGSVHMIVQHSCNLCYIIVIE